MPLDWSFRPCLVTGGAGFVGGHLCAELLKRGATVYVYDQLVPRDSYLTLAGLERRVHFIPGDVRDLDALKLALARFEIDTVFHLAAQPIVPISNTLPWETLTVNALGTYAVLESVRLCPQVKRLVVASSGAYYGTTTTDEPIKEEQPALAFTNVYAASKVAADVAVRTYAAVYGIGAAVCRFMNTYGPGDNNLSRIVPRAIHNLFCGADYDFGDRDDGSSRLDFLHIRDMASAYIAVAERLPAVAGEAFNIGTGHPTCVRDLAILISELFDGRARHPVFRGPRKPRPAIKYLDTSKARARLAWAPNVELRQGLRDTIDWYRCNQECLGVRNDAG